MSQVKGIDELIHDIHQEKLNKLKPFEVPFGTPQVPLMDDMTIPKLGVDLFTREMVNEILQQRRRNELNIFTLGLQMKIEAAIKKHRDAYLEN